jgi:thiol-disulfide isomerase/thioredoxin
MTRVPVVLLTAVLVLGGCAADPQTPAPGDARIQVDSPQLREMKQQAGVSDCEPGDAEPVDGGLPAVTLPCLGGGPEVDLSRLRGPMVVNLWQSTCQPCREEMPILQEFHEEHGDEVSVLGIDYQDVQAVAAMELVQETGVTYPLLADPQSALDGAAPFPRLRGMPFLALVDGEGRVVHRQFIALESGQELRDLVDEHLGITL